LPRTIAHYLMIGHTLMSISSAQGAWTITTLRTWGYGQKGSDPLRKISLYPGSTLGESSLPSTTYSQMILSAALKGGGCGGKNASAIGGLCITLYVCFLSRSFFTHRYRRLHSSATLRTTFPRPCPESNRSWALPTSSRGSTSATRGRTWPHSMSVLSSSRRARSRLRNTPYRV
jgi:hypothetical protein